MAYGILRRLGCCNVRHKLRKHMLRTYTARPATVVKKWYLVDAQGVVLGRLAAEIAKILRGKHKPSFTPHVNCGDNVIVINARKIQLTGKKLSNRLFHWHTGYPGGIRQRTMAKRLYGSHPERVILKAVERMMPRGSLGRAQIRNLHVFAEETHKHVAQKPEPLDIAAMNPKNKRPA